MYATVGTYRSASQINTAMAGVYKHMAFAIATSMLISHYVAGNAALMATLFDTGLKWVIIFAPLVAVFAIGFALHKVGKVAALGMLHGFAALMGLSMATLFAAYTASSIATAFFGAAVLFSLLSFYGYFTKRQLDGWGKWLIAAVVAIILVSIVNIFIGSSALQMAISALAVVIFAGLTAYDTQRIRDELSVDNGGNAEVSGALSLYLNFINIFTSLLQLTGDRE